ncbi:glycosyltransferase family 8 protein [Pandoraea bronchicola]|uniref:Glycosyltransferase n=1 Tax=Pandoraea bronchicola TaxID=2508287 RepID=A0A5E5BUM3_9BURK|nr:glycosyltransferase family 8 protein [Pandoraea bronchicola]VVE89027.1 glycosyltransferase [Pandoraea bronchicola]
MTTLQKTTAECRTPASASATTHTHYCTLFDRNYLIKGVAMITSLYAHSPDSRIHVLCMDDDTHAILSRMQLPGVASLIHLSELETPELLEVKSKRSVAEYCWTLSPSLPWHVLNAHPEIDCITYLDADLYFYSPVQPLLDEIGDSSVAIIEHRFIPRLQHLDVKGRFCVEWVTFKRDETGMACLNRWREQCIEWCYNRLEENRMGDQKYLDAWPDMWPSVCILRHSGAGVAPWNYARYEIGVNAQQQIQVDGAPLVFYHFHQFQILRGNRFDRLSTYYTVERPAPESIYKRYETTIGETLANIRRVSPGFSDGVKPWLPVYIRRLVNNYAPFWLKERVKSLMSKVR